MEVVPTIGSCKFALSKSNALSMITPTLPVIQFLQGYYVAKWYGSKVFVKILDKDSFSDGDSLYELPPSTFIPSYAFHFRIMILTSATNDLDISFLPVHILHIYHNFCAH
jgi:hypothetical protein